MDFHLNITQDVGHGVTVIFICCIFIIAAVLFDLPTGIAAARNNHEKIRSRILRRTITKILDYLRVLVLGRAVIQVRLSSENQFNYKAAYDLAVQTNWGKSPYSI